MRQPIEPLSSELPRVRLTHPAASFGKIGPLGEGVAKICVRPRKLRAIFRNSGGDETLIGTVQAPSTLNFGTYPHRQPGAGQAR